MNSDRTPKTKSRLTFGITTLALLSVATAIPVRGAASESDFKFPALLCVYRYSLVSDRGGTVDLYGFDTGEQALRVSNVKEYNTRGTDAQGVTRPIHMMTGEAKAEYPIENTPYRFRFEAKISQGLEDGRTDQLRVRTYLEKKDPATGEFSLVGQKTSSEDAQEAMDGTIDRNVYARAANHELDAYRDVNGKIDANKVEQAIQEGKLTQGALFNAGPICGLMDMHTVRSVTNHQQELADILNRVNVAQRPMAPVSQPSIAQARPEPQASPPVEDPSVESQAPQPDPNRDEFADAYPELAAPGQQPPPSVGLPVPVTRPVAVNPNQPVVATGGAEPIVANGGAEPMPNAETPPEGMDNTDSDPAQAQAQQAQMQAALEARQQQDAVAQAEAAARYQLAIQNGDVTPPPAPVAPQEENQNPTAMF